MKTAKIFGQIVGVLSFFLMLAQNVAASESFERKVSVSGNCTRQVTADRGSIVLTSEFRDQELDTAANKATKTYDRIRDEVKKLKLDDLELQTVEYNVGQIREWENNRSVFKGYRARMGLRVSTVSIQRLGEVIALATKHGIQDVSQLNMYMSQAKALKEHAMCLEEAAINARAKAEKLAGALDAKLGAVITIIEGGTSGSTPPHFAPMAEMKAAVADGGMRSHAPMVEAGQQTVVVDVQAVFALR
jgi:uncharacterized protein YggE